MYLNYWYDNAGSWLNDKRCAESPWTHTHIAGHTTIY